MISNDMTKMTLAGAATLSATLAAVEIDSAAVDKAFVTLKTYDWGADRNALNPIDEAINASHGDTAALRALEKRLVDALESGLSRSAQDYVCRRLRVVGTVQSVSALAALLPNEETSHIARYALERIRNQRATTALRQALPKISNKLKPGLIGALGVRRVKRSVNVISPLLGDSDINVARAAAHALGLIGTPAAAAALSEYAKKAPAAMKISVADASLLCAEQMLADGEKAQAIALYTELKGEGQPQHVKVAAMKGMLTAAAQK
ncbi:MAG: HEAT repeat domain-containing protein [Phycisphaerae bacterium]|nr:HEAT repeat domain-containing protein [Phycisphaerae bacterium]